MLASRKTLRPTAGTWPAENGKGRPRGRELPATSTGGPCGGHPSSFSCYNRKMFPPARRTGAFLPENEKNTGICIGSSSRTCQQSRSKLGDPASAPRVGLHTAPVYAHKLGPRTDTMRARTRQWAGAVHVVSARRLTSGGGSMALDSVSHSNTYNYQIASIGMLK